MKAEPRSQPAQWHRRPLIKAVKGMVAVTFLGGCRLGMHGAPPMNNESGKAENTTASPDSGCADD